MGKSAGKVMPRPRGAYNASETYKILDMVTLDNKLWIAKKSGITGIEPSKTAPEWMMAVDGTTDVKELETEVDAKFSSIDEQFLAKDTQISGIDTRVTATERSIEELGGRIDSIGDELVFDEKPTMGSTNLITSGAVYDKFNAEHKGTPGEDGSYENADARITCKPSSAALWHTTEQYIPFSDGTFLHRTMHTQIRSESGILLSSSYDPCSDNTATAYGNENSTIGLRGGSISLSVEYGGVSRTLFINNTRFECQDDGKFDLGGSYRKFKDIYATNGTIQTSDLTEKKDIADLNGEMVSDLVMSLRPVSFKFIDGTSDRTHYGLIAQEVETLVNNLGISNKDFAPLIKTQKVETDENGNETPIEGEYVYGLRYSEFIGILIKMCQNLQNEVDELKIRLGGE